MSNELITQLQKSLEHTYSFPDKVKPNYYPLKKSPELKKFLESLFGKGSVLVAYDRESDFSNGKWGMGGCDSVFVTKTGKVVEVTNSEWGSMIEIGRLKESV